MRLVFVSYYQFFFSLYTSDVQTSLCASLFQTLNPSIQLFFRRFHPIEMSFIRTEPKFMPISHFGSFFLCQIVHVLDYRTRPSGVCHEWYNGLACKIVSRKERQYHRCHLIPPCGAANDYAVIVFHVHTEGFQSRLVAAFHFLLTLAYHIIVTTLIRSHRLQSYDVASYRSLYALGNALGVTRSGISNSTPVFSRELRIHHVPSSARERFSVVSSRMSPYGIPV